MKRMAWGMITAASLVGCQSSGVGPSTLTTGYHDQHMKAGTTAPRNLPDAIVQQSRPADPITVAEQARAAKSAKAINDPEVVQTGYNQGYGLHQHRQYAHKVATAQPSTGLQLPGSDQVYGQNIPNMLGTPGANQGGPIYGPGGPGGGGGGMMAGGMGGPGCPPMMGGMPCPPGAGGGGGGGAGGLGPRFGAGRTQVRFIEPKNMQVAWQTAESGGMFSPPLLQLPASYNFSQAQIYRLKITNIPNRDQAVFYPTLEVYPGNGKVNAYLSHNAVPVEFTKEDFDQAQAGNYVTKVIYLPDPKFQELAIAGVETLVSTTLDPGVDPVQEANKRGAILAVVRLGGINLEMAHSPTMHAPNPNDPRLQGGPGCATSPAGGIIMPKAEPEVQQANFNVVR